MKQRLKHKKLFPSGTHIDTNHEYKCIPDLNCHLLDGKYYNYARNECISEIPPGFYCNNETQRTIDKCYQKCKTCNQGGDNNNNNCLTCDDSLFFNLGNCVTEAECTNGVFTEGFINKCKCTTDIRCKFCNETSKLYERCISCDTDNGYYPKSDEPDINSFINCYKNPEGYFLNNLQYEPCYNSCKSCTGFGDENNNKCNECKSGYEVKNDTEGDNNCYQICDHYYYYDIENNYKCTEESICPSNFNKLIETKKRCIDDCSKDSYYKYEYNDKCLDKCPDGTIQDGFKCMNKLNCEAQNLYYNYNQTQCIDTIPPGYYCNNEELKTIEKCHNNCESCITGPSSTNNNCLKCDDSLFFNLGNCVSETECTNGVFTDGEIQKCKCTEDIKCKSCNESSSSNLQCISCNNDEGYYSKKNDENNIFPYINCYKNPEGYFLKNKAYEECYSSCKYCTELGDEIDNKCIECKSSYSKKDDSKNENNCYEDCYYKYYYGNDNIYHCTNDETCPPNYNKLIENAKKCIDECKKDITYKYEFKNKCYEKCPQGTQKSMNNTFLCEEIKYDEEDKEKCTLKEKTLNFPEIDIMEGNIEFLTKEYVNEYGFSNFFVSKKENELFTVYIYKNLTCLKIRANEAPLIDFGNCYEKIKRNYSIEDDDLVITLINYKEEENSNKNFYFSDPSTGGLLKANEICAEETIIIQEDVISLMEELDDKKEEYIVHLTKQGIDVFNISDRFYNDLCFPFDSPNGRDVPMKDRIAAFYPNITLCDAGCESKGVDLQTMKAKCECIFNNLINNDLINSNLYGQTLAEIMDILSSLNIAVVKCIKELFKKEQFIKCIGGYFILALLFGEIICVIIFLIDGLYDIRKYIFSISNSLKEYNQNGDDAPPKKNKRKGIKFKNNNIDSKDKYSQSIQNMLKYKNYALKTNPKPKVGSTSSINICKVQKLNNYNNSIKSSTKMNILEDRTSKLKLKGEKISEKITKKENKENSNEEKIKELLSVSFDETDFDDVLDKEKRKFCEYFLENFKNNQIFINAFCISEIFKPKTLKILILIMTIELYFVINALFYNEEYLSELFNSNKKDSFFSFITRRFNQFIYTSFVNGVISYLIGYFFIEEEKLKRIITRNKDSRTKMMHAFSSLTKDIKQRFTILICVSIFLSIICFIYISCFNIVYPYIRVEWIKSSVFILILMQIINFLISFLHSSLRYLGIKYNSEKIFRLSVWLA